MNIIATIPEIVVSDDELISGIAFESATFTASSASSVSCSSINLSHRIIA